MNLTNSLNLFDMDWLSPALAATATTLSAGINAGATAVKNKKSYKYTKKLADYQNTINQKNWAMQNYYNSPSQQMARLKAAGLNPNLVYQQGGATAAAGEIGSSSMSQFDYESPLQGVNLGADFLAYRTASSDIEAKTATTKYYNELSRDLKANNDIKDNPVSGLSNFSLITDEEKQFYSSLFGMTPEQMSHQSVRWYHYASQLHEMARSNKNIAKSLEILEHESDITFTEAMRAHIANVLDELTLATEASKHGLQSVKTDRYGSKYFDVDITDYKPQLDQVFQTFLREYKDLHWRSSDFMHALNATSTAVGTVTGAYNSFKPTHQIKSVTEDLDFNRWKNRGRKTTYYNY